MYNIQTLNKISPVATDRFDGAKYRVADAMEQPDAILVRSASMHELALPASLKAIARAGAGTNNIPIEKCTEQGIAVFNTPGANANAVKELVLTAILLSSRKIFPAMQWVQTLKEADGDISKQVEKGKGMFVGPEIAGKKLGVIGLGAIGILVANAAEQLGMQVYGYDPYLSVDAAWGLSRSVCHAKSLGEIYENCDYITLHVPLTPETKGMVNSAAIDRMKHGVRILNFSRGELVATEDMLAALGEKLVRVYVTDFPTAEMIGHPGVLSIPHLGASTPESEDNCARMAADELIDYLENGNIRNSVNLPNVEMPRSTSIRVGIIHKNIPNMISAITTVMAQLGINIDNLTNKSKKDTAYTLLDISGDFDEKTAATLAEIEGVIRVSIYK